MQLQSQQNNMYQFYNEHNCNQDFFYVKRKMTVLQLQHLFILFILHMQVIDLKGSEWKRERFWNICYSNTTFLDGGHQIDLELNKWMQLIHLKIWQ